MKIKAALQEGGLLWLMNACVSVPCVYVPSSKPKGPDLLEEKWAADDGNAATQTD